MCTHCFLILCCGYYSLRFCSSCPQSVLPVCGFSSAHPVSWCPWSSLYLHASSYYKGCKKFPFLSKLLSACGILQYLCHFCASETFQLPILQFHLHSLCFFFILAGFPACKQFEREAKEKKLELVLCSRISLH